MIFQLMISFCNLTRTRTHIYTFASSHQPNHKIDHDHYHNRTCSVISILTNDWERNNNQTYNSYNNNGPESDYLLNNSSARHRISVRPRKTHIPIAVRRSILGDTPNIGPTLSSNNNNTNTSDRMSKITTTSHNASNQFANQSVINRLKTTGTSHIINTIKTSSHAHDTITTQTHTDHNRMYVQINCSLE